MSYIFINKQILLSVIAVLLSAIYIKYYNVNDINIYKIKVKPWSDHLKSELRRLNYPLIIRGGTNVDKWTALNKWTPKYLSDKANALLEVKIQLHNHTINDFLYVQSDSYWEDLYDFDGIRQFRKLQNRRQLLSAMNSSDLFPLIDSIHNNKTVKLSNSGEYIKLIAYAGGLESFVAIYDDIKPEERRFFMTDMNTDMPFWVGTANATSSVHYDFAHNFYVQVYGKKRFDLAPPSAHRKQLVYPALHPSHRQSFYDFRVPYTSVVLEPGDVLYVPPGWFHRVQAITTSISVSFWTDELQLVEDTLLKAPIPLEGHWNTTTKLSALVYYYQLCQWNDAVKRLSKRYQLADLFGNELHDKNQYECPNKFDILMQNQYKRKFLERCKRIENIFKSHMLTSRHPALREILLETYLEKITAFILTNSTAKYGPYFMEQCLTN